MTSDDSSTGPAARCFVPGRLCLLGEHSDWAGMHRASNPDIAVGRALVCGTQQGLEVEARLLSDEELSAFCSEHRITGASDTATVQSSAEEGERPQYFVAAEAAAVGAHVPRADREPALCAQLRSTDLSAIAAQGGWWSYVCGTMAELLLRFPAMAEVSLPEPRAEGRGLRRHVSFTVLSEDLPVKHGLSSSAAVCVAVARSVSQLYFSSAQSLDPSSSSPPRVVPSLTVEEEMDIAYCGERRTPSMCGRMDQCCAFGRGRVCLMTFDGAEGGVATVPVPVGIHRPSSSSSSSSLSSSSGEAVVHIVLVDLRGVKNTTAILAALQSVYPSYKGVTDHPLLQPSAVDPSSGPMRSQQGKEVSHLQRTEFEDRCAALYDLLGAANDRCVTAAVEALADGDAARLGSVMAEWQALFLAAARPFCPAELTSPLLYSVLRHPAVERYCHGGKGVGSQGDGTAQLVAKSAEAAVAVKALLEHEMQMPCTLLALHRA